MKEISNWFKFLNKPLTKEQIAFNLHKENVIKSKSEIENLFKKWLSYYVEEEQNHSVDKYMIHMITVTPVQKLSFVRFDIEIFTSRPGIIIGKAGKNFKELEKFVSDNVREEAKYLPKEEILLEIKLKEFNPLKFTYNEN